MVSEVAAHPDGPGTIRTPRQIRELDRVDALTLLGGVPFGRVVFTLHALPAIRPVNHLLDGDRIIIRTRGSAKMLAADGASTVLAFEADDIDPTTGLGWSVVAIGVATIVTDPAAIDRYEHTLQPWVDLDMDTVIAIRADVVTGFMLAESDDVVADHR